MALATATITYDLADQGGVDFDARRTKVWATTNLRDETVIDTAGNQIRLGSANGTVNADGTGSISVWTPGTGSNPASWQTYIHVDYPDRHAQGGRKRRTFGPFTIAASADLADLVAEMEVPAEYLTAVTADLDAIRDDARDAANDAAASAELAHDISSITVDDDVVEALVKGTAGAGPKTRAALNSSMAAGAKDPTTPLGLVLAQQNRTLEALRAFVRAGGITTTNPMVPIGDSHTDDTTAAQYLWDRLQNIKGRIGEGLEGVASTAIAPMGKNGQLLSYYRANPAQAGGFDAAMALAPSVTVSCWLTNDVRQGGLGLTVAAIRAAGAALLNAHVADLKANANRPQFIILRVPAPYATVDGGAHYINDGAGNVNPAGLAQIYTDGVRAAHYDVLKTHPDVLIYDPQTRYFGVTSPTSLDVANGYFADQIHQSQKGYEAEGDDFADWVAAAQPRKEGRAVEARRTAPSAPWGDYSRELEDTTRYALVAEGIIAEDGATTRTFIRLGPSVPSANPGNIRAGDIIQFVATKTSAVIPTGSTMSTSGANTQISFGGGASLATLGAAAVTYLDRVRIVRRTRGTDDTVNRVAFDKSNSFRRLGRVSNGGTSFVDIESASFSADPVTQTAAEWVPIIQAGDVLWIEGLGTTTVGLTAGGGTGSYAAQGALLRVSNLSGMALDFSTMIGKMVVLVGTHRDVMVGDAANTVAASGAAQTIPDPGATGTRLNYITLTGNCTFTFPKAVAGKRFDLVLKQDATGSRTATWPASFPAVMWPGGAAPTLTTTAGKSDWFRFVCHDGTNWVGEIVGQNY